MKYPEGIDMDVKPRRRGLRLPPLSRVLGVTVTAAIAFLAIALGRTLWAKPETSLQLLDQASKFVVPIAVVAIVLLLRPQIQRLLEGRDVRVKIGNNEISVTVQQLSEDLVGIVDELRSEVARIGGGLKADEGPNAPGPAAHEPPDAVEPSPPSAGGTSPPSAAEGAAPSGPSGTDTVHATHGATKPFAGAQRQVLWVDDHPEMSALDIALLERDNLRVLQAKSTDDAIDMLGRDSLRLIDAVVTTIGRREAGKVNWRAGLDLIERMKQEGLDVPVIVYSQQLSPSQRSQLREEGVIVTTRSFELLSMLGNRCGTCGKVLIGAKYFLPEHAPCPNCGSTIRHYYR
jgi:CheY-like chemotaxis protein